MKGQSETIPLDTMAQVMMLMTRIQRGAVDNGAAGRTAKDMPAFWKSPIRRK